MNLSFDTCYLKFNSPLHISNHKADSYESSEPFLRSDTLMAAIYAAWARLGHEDWIPPDGQLPFVISSAFPYWFGENGEKIHFFPKLQLPYIADPTNSNIAIKAFKKVKWIDLPTLEQFLAKPDFLPDVYQVQGVFMSKTALPQSDFILKEQSYRVTIPRDRSGGATPDPFIVERLRFVNSGLYFIVSGDWQDRLSLAMELLQYEGFGTDRNTGNGFFTFETGKISLDVPQQGKYGTTLGLFCPESPSQLEEMIDDHSQYELIKRGGWITTPGYQTIEKNSIYMFTEGSIFKTEAQTAGRNNIDLRPDFPVAHPVFRCGKTLFLPINIK